MVILSYGPSRGLILRWAGPTLDPGAATVSTLWGATDPLRDITMVAHDVILMS